MSLLCNQTDNWICFTWFRSTIFWKLCVIRFCRAAQISISYQRQRLTLLFIYSTIFFLLLLLLPLLIFLICLGSWLKYQTRHSFPISKRNRPTRPIRHHETMSNRKLPKILTDSTQLVTRLSFDRQLAIEIGAADASKWRSVPSAGTVGSRHRSIMKDSFHLIIVVVVILFIVINVIVIFLFYNVAGRWRIADLLEQGRWRGGEGVTMLLPSCPSFPVVNLAVEVDLWCWIWCADLIESKKEMDVRSCGIFHSFSLFYVALFFF